MMRSAQFALPPVHDTHALPPATALVHIRCFISPYFGVLDAKDNPTSGGKRPKLSTGIRLVLPVGCGLRIYQLFLGSNVTVFPRQRSDKGVVLSPMTSCTGPLLLHYFAIQGGRTFERFVLVGDGTVHNDLMRTIK